MRHESAIAAPKTRGFPGGPFHDSSTPPPQKGTSVETGPRLCLLFAAPATGGGESRSGLPRVCGANLQPEPEAGPAVGLPPCARADRKRPAAPAPPADYPRVCGANEADATFRLGVRGLPPRVQGGQRRPGAPVQHRRTTPACAGRTDQERGPTWATTGLPPRVRGGQAPGHVHGLAFRTTPACAGRTTGPPATRCPAPDLPPRVRGGRAAVMIGRDVRRTTPACAGRTASPGTGAQGSSDYPRVCGADSRRHSHSGMSSGLPPRVRGGPRHGARVAAPFGLPPACAGRTTRRYG